jgi:O-antigen/teichoic acid export membrane protein
MILVPLYTRFLSPTEYGAVVSMQVLSSVLSVCCTLTLERSIYALYWKCKTQEARRDLLGTIALTIVLVSSGVVCALFVFDGYVAQIYHSIPFYPYYFYGILTAFFTAFGSVPKISLMIEGKAGEYLRIMLLEFALISGSIVWFVIMNREGGEGYMKGQMIGSAFLVPLFLWTCYRVANFTFRLEVLMASLSFCLPLIPAILAAWALDFSDRIFIERYFTLVEVGVYSLGYQVAGIVVLFAGSLSLAYGPIFFRIANEEQTSTAKELLEPVANLFFVCTITVWFVVSIFSKEAVAVLFDERYAGASHFVPVIGLGFVASQINSTVGLGFQQSLRMQGNMVIAVAMALGNFALNCLLIPNFGAYGAAVATLLTWSAGCWVSEFYVRKFCFHVPTWWGQICALVIGGSLIIALFEASLPMNPIAFVLSKVLVTGAIVSGLIWRYLRTFRVALRVSADVNKN